MKLVTAGAALSAALVLAANASAGARIGSVDANSFPLVSLSVVTSSPVDGKPSLTENGQSVTGLTATNLGRAKSVVLAIDRSQSMAGSSLADATAAARTFVGQKLRADRIAVVGFGRSALSLTSFSTSTDDADSALRGLAVDSRSGTALYDAVVVAADELRRDPQPGRVIIVVTDGRDVSSHATFADAVAAARSARASVYPIGIESRAFDPAVLRALAGQTNGSYHGVASSTTLREVYSSIAAELGRTWKLSYYTSARPGDRLDLRTQIAGAGTAERAFRVPGAFAAPPIPGPSGLLPAGSYSASGTLAVAFAVGAAVFAAALMLLQLRSRGWVKSRIAPHLGEKQARRRSRERLSFLAALFQLTETAFGQRRPWRSIQRLLTRADLPLRPAEFIWASVACALGLGIFLAVAGAVPVLILVAMGLGATAPYLIVSLRVRRRARAFENQLPDLLTTIAASLKAGHSFKHGLQSVVDEAQPPANAELRRVLTEAGLGRPIDTALADMADRVGSENFSFAITAVTIQRQVGGSLAGLFDMVAETVRQRQQFARKIRSLTAMGRMSAYTLIAIPFFIGGAISMLNPSYMEPLFHTGVGRTLLFAGLTMMLVGSLLLKKIVSFRG